VAVFVPLYLDSAFNGSTYKLGNNNIPKFILPGLEFYNGVMMAIDSLRKENLPLEIHIYDTKAKDNALNRVLTSTDITDLSFIIASFNNKEELKRVSDFAMEKNIPLISATYPNDGGISANPNFILINPTLLTNIEGVFKYVQRNHPLDNIVLFKRRGEQMDEMIRNNFEEAAKRFSFSPLKIKYVELSSAGFNEADMIAALDSNKKNVVIGATLTESFAANLVQTLSNVRDT